MDDRVAGITLTRLRHGVSVGRLSQHGAETRLGSWAMREIRLRTDGRGNTKRTQKGRGQKKKKREYVAYAALPIAVCRGLRLRAGPERTIVDD